MAPYAAVLLPQLLLLLSAAAAAAQTLPCNFSSVEEALAFCDGQQELYGAIDHDLAPWRQAGGISLELMRMSVQQYTIQGYQKGIVLGFQDGKAYVVAANVSAHGSWLGHHANIMFTYMHVMLELEHLFGKHIPDVEFVITTGDKPQVLRQEVATAMHTAMSSNSDTELPPASARHLAAAAAVTLTVEAGNTGKQHAGRRAWQDKDKKADGLRKADRRMRRLSAGTSGRKHRLATEQGRSLAANPTPQGPRHVISGPESQPYLGTPPPVLRFCSSPGHADIRQPIFHFYTKKYSQRLLSLIPSINDQYPWTSRTEVLFGRFSKYLRHIHPLVNETARGGANGTNICVKSSRDTSLCTVRHHMFQIATQYRELMDISSKHKVPLAAHAKYKYLVHLDGQGLSSRLDQLLPLGSLVFKEESGYTTYYHDLLKPYKHYIPFWKQDPMDILDALAWAKAHDREAKQIALAAQAFAARYLSKRARTCYWFKLISELAKLLTYKPQSGGGALGTQWIPIKEYFTTVAMVHEGGKRFKPSIEQ